MPSGTACRRWKSAWQNWRNNKTFGDWIWINNPSVFACAKTAPFTQGGLRSAKASPVRGCVADPGVMAQYFYKEPPLSKGRWHGIAVSEGL